MKGFWRDVRRGLRSRGVFLDAEQARVILSLAQDARAREWPRALRPNEREVLERFEKRCRELG